MMAGKTEPLRCRTACILSPHAWVRAELKTLLACREIRPIACRCPPDPRDWPLLEIPRASIYVVDAFLPRPRTETLVSDVLARFPRARIVVLAEEFSDSGSFSLLGLGVKGLVTYSRMRDDLPPATRAVAKGGFWVPRSLLSRFVDRLLDEVHGRDHRLGRTVVSKREKEVLAALLDNLSNKEIGSRLHISERTVKFHISNLLAKFSVPTRQQLISICFGRPSPELVRRTGRPLSQN